MATYKIIDKKNGKEIGTIIVHKHGVELRPVKKYRLKTWVKVTLWTLAIAGACTLCVLGLKAWAKQQHDWYQECDQAYGYTTSYYTCRNYHIRGGK